MKKALTHYDKDLKNHYIINQWIVENTRAYRLSSKSLLTRLNIQNTLPFREVIDLVNHNGVEIREGGFAFPMYDTALEHLKGVLLRDITNKDVCIGERGIIGFNIGIARKDIFICSTDIKEVIKIAETGYQVVYLTYEKLSSLLSLDVMILKGADVFTGQDLATLTATEVKSLIHTLEQKEKERHFAENNIFKKSEIRNQREEKAPEILELLDAENVPLECAKLAYSYAFKCLPLIPYKMSIDSLKSTLKRHTEGKFHSDTLGLIISSIESILVTNKSNALKAISIQDKGQHNHIVLNSFDEFKPEYKGVYLVKAQTGMGKTQKIGIPYSDWCKDSGKPFTAIAHLRSLITELSNRLKTDHYEDEKATYKEALKIGFDRISDHIQSLSVCIQSLDHKAFHQFNKNSKHIFIDEITQVLAVFKVEEIFKHTDVENVFKALKQIVTNAECVIVADANINQDTLNFLAECRPNDVFNIVEVLPQNENKAITLYQKQENLIENIIYSVITEDKKVWLACDSANEAKNLKTLFDNYSIKSIAIVGSQHKVKGTKEFLQAIESESKKYQIVIASPAIMSGISVEHHNEPYFDYVAGVFKGKSVSSLDAIQMIGRVRYAKEFHIFAEHKYHGGMSHADVIAGKIEASEIENSKGEVTAFTRHIEKLISVKDCDTSNFANNLYYLLEHYKFSIKRSDYSVNQEMLTLLKSIKKELSEKETQGILDAEILTQKQASEYEKADYLEDEQLYSLKAYQRRLYLNLPFNAVLTKDDLKTNMAQLMRYKAFRDGEAKSTDKHKDITLRKYAEATAKYYHLAFKNLNMVGGAGYGVNEANHILNEIEPYRMVLSAIGAIPKYFGNSKYKRSRYPIKELNKILNHLGIETTAENRRSNTKSGQMAHNLYIQNSPSVPIEGEKIYTLNAGALQKLDLLVERHLKKLTPKVELQHIKHEIMTMTDNMPIASMLEAMNDCIYVDEIRYRANE